jgi:transcriptional regulator with XRE-family HTH domain
MTLGEKIRYLREIEGTLRGLGRAMTQLEVVHAVKSELGKAISQSYLSQIESGRRPHMTHTTRQLIARFFKIHPGYLVEDPNGYQAELISDLRAMEDRLDTWLIDGADRFIHDPELHQSILILAQQPDSRKCLLLLHTIMETPGLVDRLSEALNPAPLHKPEMTRSHAGDSLMRRRRNR